MQVATNPSLDNPYFLATLFDLNFGQMRCYLLWLLIAVSSVGWAQDRLNVELFGQFHRGDQRYSGCWAYVAEDGREYALLGTRTGTAIYTIDNVVEELDFVSGPASNWREITVIGHHAFVTTEGITDTTGMQILDLQFLPERVELVTTYTETFNRGHIIQRDIYTEAPYVYINGTTTTAGVHILDVSNPQQPQEIGLYAPGYYIHDCHVKGDLLFAAAINEGVMDVVDISDKTNPVLLAKINTTGGDTHSSWLSEDNRYLFMCPEKDGLPARIYRVDELDNIDEVATYSANFESLVHNPYIRGDFAFISHNTEGLRVVDIADPELPLEVGYYDTFDGPSGGFSGLWSACPYYPSGKIIGGNREDGLYVWTFNNTRAARLYLSVQDSLTDELITNAEVFIQTLAEALPADPDGRFRWVDFAQDLRLEVTAPGYFAQVAEVEVAEGAMDTLIVKLLRDAPAIPQDQFDCTPLSLYPNPSLDRVTLSLSPFSDAHQLNIYTASGALRAQYAVAGKARQDLYKNQVGGTGYYYLALLNQNGDEIGCGVVVWE